MKKIIALTMLMIALMISPSLKKNNDVKSAEITITLPDPYVTRVLDGVCGRYNYDPNTDGTQANFVKKQTRQFWKETTLAWEYDQAKEAITSETLDLEE